MSENFLSKKGQLKKIKSGKGVQYILDEAYKILGNPILAHNMEYKVIARTKNTVTDDPIWNEFKITGMVGHDRLDFYKNEHFFELTANAKKIAFLLSDKLKYDRIYGKLFTKHKIQIGCACMVACYRAFEDDDSVLFEIVCDVLTREFCMSEFYQTYGQAYMETLVSQLIEDSIEDKDLYLAHMEGIYMSLKGNLHLAVADIAQCDPTYAKLAYFKDIFKQACSKFKYFIYSNYIVILMSSDHNVLRIDDLDQLYGIFEQNNICAGISSCFENLNELPNYYNEAVIALNYIVKNGGRHRIFLYEDIPSGD